MYHLQPFRGDNLCELGACIFATNYFHMHALLKRSHHHHETASLSCMIAQQSVAVVTASTTCRSPHLFFGVACQNSYGAGRFNVGGDNCFDFDGARGTAMALIIIYYPPVPHDLIRDLPFMMLISI